MVFHEHFTRSITKAVTFRIIVIFSDVVVVYAVTKQADFTLSVVAYTNLLSTILYFFHERIWNHITWGKHRVKK